MAASMIWRSTASGIGSGLRRRMARCVVTVSKKSMAREYRGRVRHILPGDERRRRHVPRRPPPRRHPDAVPHVAGRLRDRLPHPRRPDRRHARPGRRALRARGPPPRARPRPAALAAVRQLARAGGAGRPRSLAPRAAAGARSHRGEAAGDAAAHHHRRRHRAAHRVPRRDHRGREAQHDRRPSCDGRRSARRVDPQLLVGDHAHHDLRPDARLAPGDRLRQPHDGSRWPRCAT